MTLSPDNSTADAGTAGSTQFNAIIEPSDATDQSVTYELVDEGVEGITVDLSGLVTWTEATPAGTYTIKATTTDGSYYATGTLDLVEPGGGE